MKISVGIAFFGAVVAATTVCAEWNPETRQYETDGYVLYAENTTDNNICSLHTGMYWSDGKVPENGKKYFIPATSLLRAHSTKCTDEDKTTFRGDVLAFAGTSQWAQSPVSIPEFHLLSGSDFSMYNGRQTFQNGIWRLYPTKQNGNVLMSWNVNNYAGVNLGVSFKSIALFGDADTELIFRNAGSKNTYVYADLRLENDNDFSGFSGKLTIRAKTPAEQYAIFNVVQPAISMPGTLSLEERSELTATNDATSVTVGALAMGTNARLFLRPPADGSAFALTVNGAFTHADTKVPLTVFAKPLGNVNFVNGKDVSITQLTTVDPVTNALFRMKVADEADDTPRFALDDFALNYPGKGTLGLPTVLTEVERKDGYDTLTMKVKGIVRKNTNSEGTFGSSLTNGLAWSDGIGPRSGWDYFANTSVNVPVGEWTFAGDSLTLGAKSNIYGDLYFKGTGRAVLRIDRLGLEGGTKVWTNSRDGWLFAPQIVTYASALGPVSFQAYGDGRLTVVGEISGDADLFLRYHANKRFGVLAKGYLTLWGANTNLSGKVMLGCEAYDNQSANEYVANEKERIEVTVGDGRALGGDLPAFAYDGLRIRDWALLNVTNTTEFAAANRGVFVDWMGCIGVKEGCVATFRNPFTFGGVLKKQGGGTLALGGTAPKFAVGSTDHYTIVDDPVDGTNVLEVAEGSVMPLSKEAFNGLAIKFAKGTSLHLDYAATDADVLKYGLYDPAGSIAFAEDVDRIDVTFDSLPDGKPTEDRTFGVVTVPTDKVDEVLAKLNIRRPKGMRLAVNVVPDGDNSVVTATVGPTGLVLLVR